MQAQSRRHIRQLREGLVRNLALDFYEEDEITAVLRQINSFHPRIRQKVLALCHSLSHASSSLLARTIRNMKAAAALLSHQDAERWITHAFDLLESKGIDPFMCFITETDRAAMERFQHPDGLCLHEVKPVLEAFLGGVSGTGLKIAQDGTAYTDTATVYLHAYLDLFKDREENFLLYKCIAAHLWTQIAGGTLLPDPAVVSGRMSGTPDGRPDLSVLFPPLPDREFTVGLFTALEAFRLEGILRAELPGLLRAAEGVRTRLFQDRPSLAGMSEPQALVEGLYQYYLKRQVKGVPSETLSKAIDAVRGMRSADGVKASLDLLFQFWGRIQTGIYGQAPGLFLMTGTIRPEKVSDHLSAQRQMRRRLAEGKIRELLEKPDLPPQVHHPAGRGRDEMAVDPQKDYLLIRGRLIEVDDEVRDLLNTGSGIPGGILVQGSDMGGGSPLRLDDLIDGAEEALECDGQVLKYDEWDFRRGDYKRQWCSLYEHEISPGHEPFVEMTLMRYGGYVKTLRKKFELLRREPKVLRRQKEGEDVDIDAMIEAFADIRAGISPGENLFTCRDRSERNIAVAFLLDMSGSTKGWVNEVEKEALVLMCEALESLGDRYAVYGFSGMTRTKCDFYKVKGFSEPYSAVVRKRISGITPKDYTRMGPPIRHCMTILRAVDARTKLLITLSDGKPEDWDAYKGDYGIEDTRKALIEAREQGIHPFCITIDREAVSYLPHMFGEAQYILIDDVRKLPSRITEIYRRLTS